MMLYLILLIPLGAALISLFPAKTSRISAWATIFGALAVLYLACRLSFNPGALIVAEHSWLACDALSALVLVLVAFVGTTASLFSLGYMAASHKGKKPGKIQRYYARFNLFLMAMLAVPLLAHLAILWIAVELTTLLSVFLVGFENTPEALEAAWKYVVLTCMGAALALVGILILYWGLKVSGSDTFTWAGLTAAAPKIPPAFLKTAFLFILVGFGTKAGLVPLHTWLPDAHSQAPSPVCALLSGIETTTALYVILRLLPILGGLPGHPATAWILTFGLLSAGAAAFLLIQVKDYKRLFAFSTIEHMGIILVAAGLGTQAGHLGAMSQILAHTVTKSSCFFAAGAALLATGTREISSVRGLIRTSPVAGTALMLGGLAIAGAPPFAIFLSEFSIIKAGIAADHYLVIGGLTLFIIIAFCGIMYQINRMIFGKPPRPAPLIPLPLSCKITLVVAFLPVLILGVYQPHPLHTLLQSAALLLGR